MRKSEVNDLLSKAKAADNLYYEQIIQKWKSAWMSDAQNPPEEHKNYFHRAFGIDANMKHSLAKMLAEDSASEAITRLAEISLEALEVIGFYAEEKNWDYEEGLITKKTVINEDFGGKRAREFLQKIGET